MEPVEDVEPPPWPPKANELNPLRAPKATLRRTPNWEAVAFFGEEFFLEREGDLVAFRLFEPALEDPWALALDFEDLMDFAFDFKRDPPYLV